MYNILKLNELITWALPFNHKIYWNILNHPEELNIRVLPKHLKALAAERLKPFLHLERVGAIIQYMNSEDWHETLYNKFITYTKILDNNRNESLFDLVEEFQ